MSTQTDLYLKNYAVCVANNIRYYVGIGDFPSGLYVPAGWSVPAAYNGAIICCAFMGDTDRRVPFYYYTDPDSYPAYYTVLTSSATEFLKDENEIPVFYERNGVLYVEYRVQAYTWSWPDGVPPPAGVYASSVCFYSDDCGKTWSIRPVNTTEVVA